MTALDCLSFVWLVPVRGAGPRVHYVKRDGRLGVDTGPALCGALGPLDRYARPKWRRVRTPGAGICLACHAAACSEPTRVDWGS